MRYEYIITKRIIYRYPEGGMYVTAYRSHYRYSPVWNEVHKATHPVSVIKESCRHTAEHALINTSLGYLLYVLSEI